MDVLPADGKIKPSDMIFPSAAVDPLTYCSSHGGGGGGRQTDDDAGRLGLAAGPFIFILEPLV
jgi:hypothetical protein